MKNKGRVLKRESEREAMNERMRVQDALKGNSIEITEDSLLGLKYDPASIWGYFEQLHIEQGPVLELVGFPLTVVKGIATQTGMKMMKQRHKVEREANIWTNTKLNFQIHLFTSVHWVECWLHTFRLNVSVF
ncbi:hypothetical protein ERO13_D10G154500v2 [Gossypium hirsutum]|uniref:Uncharacterized protein n=1 Tax=Gossypium barbadense TaxID=3634 RepID=A0A5J5PW21_GOSBA|nr:hypothetical protein ES319_D10G171000v1 [Gossypium barbadense]KAG4126407.1 hypothetical protein ERO13_D10G154500v2 [Gossypium hirsutum]